MVRNRRLPNVFALVSVALAAGVLITVALTPSASAKNSAKEKMLYAFCPKQGCADGIGPQVGLVADGIGNLYGMTESGGTNYWGAVYELTKTGKGKYAYSVVYSFCGGTGCGSSPVGALVIDHSGDLYGVASVGGAHYAGQIFELVPDANHTTWIYQALYDFCSAYKCADGGFPGASPLTYAGASTGKPYDGKSPLFGTTAGGNTNGGGVAYEIQPSGGGWSEKVLYSFCAADNCTDGYAPDAPLFVVSNKRVIGTTFEGGLCMPGCGTVFELDAGKTTWTQSLLHEFCSEDNCADGTEPEAGVVMDAEGDLFGVTLLGGNSCDLFYGIYSCGVAYKLTSSKEGWTETVVHAFCAKPGCADGALPEATPVTDGSGNVWGTAPDGGDTTFDSTGGGTVFEITGGLTFATRYKFCPHADCPKGAGPVAPLLASKKGELFGTALRGGNGGTGGNDGGGVVYELKP